MERPDGFSSAGGFFVARFHCEGIAYEKRKEIPESKWNVEVFGRIWGQEKPQLGRTSAI